MKKPSNPRFSSGPTTKHPGWSIEKLNLESLGRSHRSTFALKRIQHLLKLTRSLLEIPETYYLGIVPASCTGAMEMAMWNLLGSRPIDVFSWGVFGGLWTRDIVKELKVKNTHIHEAPHGRLPQLSLYNPNHDCVFTYNETTTGVRIPHTDWIPTDRAGLTICDATSALFSHPVDWSKLDATAFSWQKCLGGEAGQGMLVLSPRAVERLESHTPQWPIPRLFRITKDRKLINVIFEGMTLITTSMLCVEDALSSLEWSQSIGGVPALTQRSKDNFSLIENWIKNTPWVDFMAEDPLTRSTTSVCFKLIDVPRDEQWDVIHKIRDSLDQQGIAHDIAGHKYADPCLRIWAGPMIEKSDLEALFPWIENSYFQAIT